jgi:hypothetical protein
MARKRVTKVGARSRRRFASLCPALSSDGEEGDTTSNPFLLNEVGVICIALLSWGLGGRQAGSLRYSRLAVGATGEVRLEIVGVRMVITS